MPIFSSNRVSYGGTTVAADTRYTEKDFGRIMSECASNDMKVFNAALARDFKEIEAMQEGTMLEYELQTFQEFSVKEAWKSLKEKLKKLWTKIKGVFKNVYAKLTLWLVRDNKTFIAMHKKELLSKDCRECKCPKFRNPKGEKFLNSIADIKASEYKNLIEKVKSVTVKDFETDKAKEFIDSWKTTKGGEHKIVNADDIYDAMLKNIYDEANENLKFKDTVYNGKLTKLFENLSATSIILKNLKKSSKDIDGAFNDILKALKKAESETSDENNSKLYNGASQIVSHFQTQINASTSAMVRMAKFQIKNDRGLIATLVAYNPKAVNDAAMLESAYMEGFDRFFFEAEEETPEEVEADAEELKINIDISGGDNVDVEVNDDTDDD